MPPSDDERRTASANENCPDCNGEAGEAHVCIPHEEAISTCAVDIWERIDEMTLDDVRARIAALDALPSARRRRASPCPKCGEPR